MMTLKEKYEDYFLIGAAVNNKTIHTHNDILQKHFNSITCENEMKWGEVTKKPNQYDFSKADEIVSYARNNNFKLRGHTFAWHNQIPSWLFQDGDKKELLRRLEEHIVEIGKRYEEDIFCWDAVNEAIADDDSGIMRKSGWVDILGEDFMDEVFRVAHKILPNTTLLYNDYNESDPVKLEKICGKLHQMIDRGVPIHGVGLQCHWNIFSPTEDEIKRSMEAYAKLGLKIHITEMDVSMFAFEDHGSVKKPTKKMLQMQMDVYERAFRLFREYKEQIECVTLWGIADDETWLDHFPVRNRKNWPLLFDEEHNPKEVYSRIMDF